MARLESQAQGGYYKTPVDQIPRIAGLLSVAPKSVVSICDPCAGDGEAIQLLARAIAPAFAPSEEDFDPASLEAARAKYAKEVADCKGFEFYACELEASRHAALGERLKPSNWQNEKRALRGDAFRVMSDGKGVGLLWLNPPYDTDRVHGRLEEKFLARFTAALAPGGVLVFIVPHYALAASTQTLGRCYTDLSCYRFAGGDYEAYKQVALLAKRQVSDLHDADAEIVAKVERWAADAGILPALPPPLPSGVGRAPYTVPRTYSALSTWKMADLDVAGLVGKFVPWHETTRARGLSAVARILPDTPIAELLHRTYKVATPPRPAHIAAGIAAGIFNGSRIEPDDPRSKLPPLLVKGVFDREWRTVEEKVNKDGEKTSEVQVQQPKLVVTVLDLEKHLYHTVASTNEVRGKIDDVAQMGVADLLQHYGQALMGVMERQCEILYDPRTDAGKVQVADSPRKLFTAQAHAVRACVALLREGCHPWLLGEIGSGKSSVALMVAKTQGARRVLIVTPPHLVTKSWPDEIAATVPEADVRVLGSISDVEAFAQIPAGKPAVAILSREVAKLGHAWEGVGDACPKCGLPTAGSAEERAKKRARCEQKTLVAKDDLARLARRLAFVIRPVRYDATVRNVLRGRLDREIARRRASVEGAEWRGLPADLALELRVCLASAYVEEKSEDLRRAIAWSFAAAPDAGHLAKMIPLVHDGGWECFAAGLALLCGVEGVSAVRAAVESLPEPGYGESPAKRFQRMLEAVAPPASRVSVAGCEISWKEGEVYVDGVEAGSVEAACEALRHLVKVASWGWTESCGEHLYQAIPEPRRHPLAECIVRYHKETFDFLVLDEGHEYQNDDSAQGKAAHRLTTLKLPTVFMTGTVMNGYAESLFANMWALSSEFREEFERGDASVFNERYGYRKRVLQDRADGEVVVFGSQTDRVERCARDAGHAPGVLPLFLFRHLLPSAVTLHKADLRIELPPHRQERVPVELGGEVRVEYKKLLETLKRQITRDRFEEGLAGKLFGALSELPSYLDRCTADVGNAEGGAYQIRYPESCGGKLVAEAKSFPASVILPKEEWLLDAVEVEIAEGRNVMVFGWHLGLLPRLARLISARIGEPVPILYADKVATGKRQAWIDREIVKKARRVMVANPVAIQTGLNNLVHFATEIWHENPACNPITYRQAVGRIDRIGQRLPTRVLFAHYDNTLQSQLYDLLIAKVAISTATDGLDPESALIAAGMGSQEMLTGLSIGKQLWAMMAQEEGGEVVAIERARRRRVR